MTAAHNAFSGYTINSGEMTLEQSVARGNQTGLTVGSSGTAHVANSVLTGNGTGVSVDSSSTLLTRGNSTVSGNTADVSGVLTPLAAR